MCGGILFGLEASEKYIHIIIIESHESLRLSVASSQSFKNHPAASKRLRVSGEIKHFVLVGPQLLAMCGRALVR